MSKSYLDGAGVGTLSSLMKKAVKDTVESTKEQLFVVTVTPKGEPTEDENSTTYPCTPSVTFAEAVAQVKSGKKVVIGAGNGSDKYVQLHYESSPNLLLSDDEFYLSYDQNIKTFRPFISQHFQWSRGGLILIAYNTLPKWIGDTKPTYTASEVGADESGAAVQASKDMQAWVIGEGYQTAAEVQAAIESAKEQLFVVTITSNGPPENVSDGALAKYTPSVTFAEAVAQAKSGKQVVIGPDGAPLDSYVRMHLISSSSDEDIFFSDDKFGQVHEENIKTFTPCLLEYFQWDSSRLIEIILYTLPKWIGDTKPTYTASEVGAATKPKRVSVTLTASGWDPSKKTQMVTVNGVLADESAQVIQPIPALASQSAYNAAGILATGQAANIIIFTASTVPTADLSVYIVITEVTA